MVKASRKMQAQTTCRVFFSLANRLVRYCGTVMESPAALENSRSLLAQKIQLAAVPRASPMPIQIWPKPKARMEPGSPINSQADISEACADMAVTQGPMLRPPRKKSF